MSVKHVLPNQSLSSIVLITIVQQDGIDVSKAYACGLTLKFSDNDDQGEGQGENGFVSQKSSKSFVYRD